MDKKMTKAVKSTRNEKNLKKLFCEYFDVNFVQPFFSS